LRANLAYVYAPLHRNLSFWRTERERESHQRLH